MRHVERIARAFRRAYAEHQLATHTAAIAFQVLIALVPLTLLGLALLGALGLEDVWTSSIAPTMRGKLSPPVFEAIDYSVKKIFADNSPGLIVFATLLLAWQLAWAERAVGAALNAIHEAKETRSLPRRVLLAVGLGVAVGALVVTSVLVAAVVPRLANGGLALGLKLVGFLGAALLLTVAIGLLVRYSPAEHPEVF